MEAERNVLKASWLLLALSAIVPVINSLEVSMGSSLRVTRHNNGDIFTQYKRSDPFCSEDTCVGMSSGTASALSETDLCTCRCHPHLPAFREDLRICVDDIHECALAPFVGGSTSQQIPFVFLPLKGQIIHPSKEISFAGIQTPVCAVSGAKFMTEGGWVELRNPVDADVPFRLFRDEGRTFLQWVGEPDLRNRMSGRLVLVHLICRELTTDESFSPCVAFRVVGSPTKFLANVSEVAFVPDAHSSTENTDDSHLSVTEYVAIGVCSILLGLIYVASVFLYIHLRKRNSSECRKNGGLDSQSLAAVEEGIVKSNPLLSMTSHFPPTESTYSDSNSSDTDVTPDIIQHHGDRKKHMQITAMIHPQKQLYCLRSRSPSFSSLESFHQDSTTNERLPEENVSIIETPEGREDRPDNLRVLTGTTRKKLYFNPAYFEPELMLAPPPAALEFLSKIREVIGIAKQKMASKRFSPSLLNIPEEENQYSLTPSHDFSKPVSRRSSAISLKRENSRRKTCTGCPGCEPQDFNSFTGKLPELPSLGACQNCTVTTEDSKQRSIRKWLEDVPIMKAGTDSAFHHDDVLNKSINSLRKVRSPTRSLPPDKFDSRDQQSVLSPRPASESGSHRQIKYKIIRTNQLPKQSTQSKEENHHYETLPEKQSDVTMNFPPPDMIHEAMVVDKTDEKVATLTKNQMKAVINELTVHRDLLLQQNESVTDNKVIDYEADSLERSGNKGFSTPTEYAEVSSSQPSPSLSTALPDQEEMTMRNAIFNKKTGNMTISKINMDVLQEDDHDYELIVLKKGTVIDGNLHKLPELLKRNKGYSLVSEVYVNNGYNYGSNPSSPTDSNCSSLEKKSLKVRYDEGIDKPGRLLIEVEDCPDNYIPVHDSDGFEPDTLDRKPSKKENRPGSHQDMEYVDSLERPHQILLRTTGSFKNDSNGIEDENVEPSNFNRVFGSLREIYEAKTKGLILREIDDKDLCSILSGGTSIEGRLLTLEERHSKRQRSKGIVQPDVIPPPPHDGSPIYEHPKPPRKLVTDDDRTSESAVLSKNSPTRSVDNQNLDKPTHSHDHSGDTPEYQSDYKLCVVQKSRKDGNITNLIPTENIYLKRDNNNQLILQSSKLIIRSPFFRPSKGNGNKTKNQKRTWRNPLKPEDSGYLSTDSNGSTAKHQANVSEFMESDTDESLGDGHSESGAESVETHSVFFHRQPNRYRGYASLDSGVMGGEDGQSSSDSETVSYRTVIPVTVNRGHR